MRNLIIVINLFLIVGLTTCSKTATDESIRTTSSSPSSQSSTNNVTLTTERAQKAIDKFMAANAKGSMTIKSGVREVSSENSALADVVLKDFVSNDGKYYPGNGGGWSGGGEWASGKVVFSRFTNGKWVLSQVLITHNAKGQSVTYKPNIEVD